MLLLGVFLDNSPIIKFEPQVDAPRSKPAMCQPIRYVYPSCGHPVIPEPESWILERCRRAMRSNRECWVPLDILDEAVEERPWPNDRLKEPCGLCESAQDATETMQKSELKGNKGTKK
ncbi:hypothetical protein ACJ41O_003840 [Fusarium nematophilum]